MKGVVASVRALNGLGLGLIMIERSKSEFGFIMDPRSQVRAWLIRSVGYSCLPIKGLSLIKK